MSRSVALTPYAATLSPDRLNRCFQMHFDCGVIMHEVRPGDVVVAWTPEGPQEQKVHANGRVLIPLIRLGTCTDEVFDAVVSNPDGFGTLSSNEFGWGLFSLRSAQGS